MPQVTINGRRVAVPEVSSGRQIQAAGNMDPNRRLMRRSRTGNYYIKPDERFDVEEGSIFIDAPRRVKGMMR